jgi:hypothetical protein
MALWGGRRFTLALWFSEEPRGWYHYARVANGKTVAQGRSHGGDLRDMPDSRVLITCTWVWMANPGGADIWISPQTTWMVKE